MLFWILIKVVQCRAQLCILHLRHVFLASMNAVKTNVIAFDTTVVDLTDLCQDPVDLLYWFSIRWRNRYS